MRGRSKRSVRVLRRRRRLGAGRVYLARHDGPFTFPDGEVTEVACFDLDAVPEWLDGRQVCPDSVALVLPRLGPPG